MTDLAGTTRYAGSRVHRVEDARLLTGRGTFVDDVKRPGMLHACFVRSPFARARIDGIDTDEALALDGVHAVYTAADLNPDLGELWWTGSGPEPTTPMPPLADGEARFVGDPVALVVADNRYVAEDATELVLVDYEPLEAVADYLTAADTDELVHEDYPDNIIGEIPGGKAGDASDALSSSPHVIEHSLQEQAYAAVPIETRGLIVEWDPTTEEVSIWAATQAPHEVRAVCARVLGLAEHRVRVVMRDTGGGFGQKVIPQRDEVCVMLAARRCGGALKWIEDRQENLLAAGQARHESGVMRMGFADDGTITAATIDHTQDNGAYPVPYPVMTGAAVGTIYPGPYRIPATAFTHRSVFTNTVGRTAYRGPWAFESMAREVTLDVAARQLGLDPVELRRRNILHADEMPYSNGNGMPYSHVSPSACFEQALEMLGVDEFRREQAEAREHGRHLGLGVSNYIEPTTPGYGYYGTEGATIRIEPDGKVNVYVAGGSSGNSIETTVVQLTADALGVSIEDVNTIQGDTAVTPFGAGTGGSRSGSMTAGAVSAAGSVLRDKLTAIAAHQLEAAADDIEIERSQAYVRGTPARTVSVPELANLAYFKATGLPEGVSPGLEASERYAAASPMPIWANATHVCTCEVDVETGAVELLRHIVSEDCGPMINPTVVEGQIAGGTVQGIGGALFEELSYDEEGNATAASFMDYLLPTMAEVPRIEYGHVETPGPGPGGYKGVGEGGAIGSAPAIVNSVADALSPFGVVVDRLPLSPARVVELIARAGTTD
ncbi:MAG: xanthine dehydrogenase family protein molybdopterin-binding subunit [Acidimicrobiales bacterium]|nr:xanthine dehydrogenase family protein molybdopterin-binding subunit [Acidimicrobiales bacterium]